MSAILNSLNVHNLLIFQPILMILVSKFMVYRVLSDKTYLLLGLLSPLKLYSLKFAIAHVQVKIGCLSKLVLIVLHKERENCLIT